MDPGNTPFAPSLLQMAQAAMLENTGTQLAFLDADFNFVCVNSAYARGCGHTAEELIGRNHFDLFPGAENRAIFERARDTGQAVEFHGKPFEFVDQPERGVTYWDWTLAPVGPGRQGDVGTRRHGDAEPFLSPGRAPQFPGMGSSAPALGLVLSLTDVTEQVRARHANERSEAKFRNLFAGMREGMALHEIICDPDGAPVDYRFLDANPAFAELTGLKPEEIIGKTVLEVLPETEPYWIATYGEVALAGKPARFEAYSQALNAWYQVAAYSPAPGQFVAIFTDVTERRQMEEELRRARDELQGEANRLEARVQERTAQLTAANLALERQAEQLENVYKAVRESEERFRTSVEGMLDAFAIFSAQRDESGAIVDFRYEYINQAGCAANRLAREETIARGMLEIFPAHRASGLFQEYCEVVETGRPLIKESLFYEDVWAGERLLRAFDVRASKLGDGLAVAWRDISERKQAEEELRQSRLQLQNFSRRLVETQEGERRAIARELHDEVGQALTVMKLQVHAFNSLAGDSLAIAAQTREVLQSIESIMETLHRLAVDLRPAGLDRVGLLPSLKQLVETFQKRTGIVTEMVTIGLDGRRLVPEIETMVYRVVQEALTNVARHSGAGHVGVIVEQHSARLVIIIEDDGTGFDVQEALRSGRLGLVGIRERAEMLGGKFSVESVGGGGTTIFVDVPCQY